MFAMLITAFHNFIAHLPASAASWGAFTAGQAFHIYARADLSKKSKINGVKTRREWIGNNLSSILVRSFLSVVGWAYVMAHPDALGHVASSVGLSTNLTVDATPPVAGLFGLGANHGLDYLGAKFGFQKEIPPLNGDAPQSPAAQS